ncbi:mannose-1-phosphate guanylyltransferase [Cetobacterium sp.]|uniref:mannose-1-phosphate guanylyltransferase n=1 Tax=Cetobacterium sp. TaxID=2071632 RepID=UPI002FC651E9
MIAAIIMAGGSGERFWPLSTPQRPKQLLSLFSEKSMIKETLERVTDIVPLENIFISTNVIQADMISKELPEIKKENIILEPLFKDTAAAISYASLIIRERFKSITDDIQIVVLASDHIIKNISGFQKAIISALEVAKNSEVIVTLGVKPNRPETGYGYIEIGENNSNIQINQVYKVKKFREKPNLQTAESYIDSGNFFWNSGIFIFSLKTIFKNLEILMEDYCEILQEIAPILKTEVSGKELANSVYPYFLKFEKISIDFGILEYSKNLRVIPVDIGWSDVGSFKALEDILPFDENQNIIKNTKVVSQDSHNNIIIAEGSIISLLGVNNLIIIKNNEHILICDKNKSQDLKKIVAKHSEGR